MLTQKLNQTRLDKSVVVHLLDGPSVHYLSDLACTAQALLAFTAPQLAEPVICGVMIQPLLH